MKKNLYLFILILTIFISCGKKEKEEKITEEVSYNEIQDENKESPKEDSMQETQVTTEASIEEKDKNIDEIIKDVLPSGNGELAILVDDSGASLDLAKEFDSLDMKISFAVLPYLAKSREVNRYLSERGYTVILHLPMEGSDAGVNERTKGLLKTSLSKEEMTDIFDKALENVGPVRGFNNHMGSVFTSSEESMATILSYAKEKRLFYIDSKTIAGAKGYRVAKELFIPTAQCVHFLDNSKEVADIEKEIIKAAKIAQKRGKALVIGHFHKNMLEALKNSKQTLINSGINLVFVDEILE